MSNLDIPLSLEEVQAIGKRLLDDYEPSTLEEYERVRDLARVVDTCEWLYEQGT